MNQSVIGVSEFVICSCDGFCACSMRLGMPFIAPRRLGVVGSSFRKQSTFHFYGRADRWVPSVAWHIGQGTRDVSHHSLEATTRPRPSTRRSHDLPDAVTTRPTQSRFTRGQLPDAFMTRPKPITRQQTWFQFSWGQPRQEMWFWFAWGQPRRKTQFRFARNQPRRRHGHGSPEPSHDSPKRSSDPLERISISLERVAGDWPERPKRS
jgi:hypothetical protein